MNKKNKIIKSLRPIHLLLLLFILWLAALAAVLILDKKETTGPVPPENKNTHSQTITLNFEQGPIHPDRIDIQQDQDTLILNLEACASCGFDWSVKSFDQKFLKLVANNYTRPQLPKGEVGGIGTRRFIFKINPEFHHQNMSTVISLKYGQEWDKNSMSDSNFVLNSVGAPAS